MAFSERAAKYNDGKFSSETRKAQDAAGIDFHPRLYVGAPAPDFTAYQLDGTALKLSDFAARSSRLRFRLPHGADLYQRSSIGCIESSPAPTPRFSSSM